jgi:hypothetical protein
MTFPYPTPTYGWTCPYCNSWVPNGTLHSCTVWPTVPAPLPMGSAYVSPDWAEIMRLLRDISEKLDKVLKK